MQNLSKQKIKTNIIIEIKLLSGGLAFKKNINNMHKYFSSRNILQVK